MEDLLESKTHLRLTRIRNLFSDASIDTMLVLVAENRRYLSGFTAEDTQFDESSGALFISQERTVLATDSRYELQARSEAPSFQIHCYRKGLEKALPEILSMLGTKRLGFEGNRLSFQKYQKLTKQIKTSGMSVELVETENLTDILRIKKDESEISEIKKALILAENTFCDVLQIIQPGTMEKEVAWMMEKGMREAGADAVSFPTIVASGPNSALPHATPGERRIRAGEPILFDWGAKRNGYCSDISRTICIGKPDGTFEKVFQTVHEAQQKAIEAIRPGVSTKHVDGIARGHIEKNGFKGKFGHSLGHGTGLSIHEYPRLSQLYDKPLESGMVCTVEPGVYLPDWGGIRIENMIVVRDDGAEVLNELKTTF
jgi:Xaa-Pro aminopeptidase